MIGRRLCYAAVLLCLLTAAPAAGAAAWRAATMAIPQTVQGQLLSVSCGAGNACEGVGQVVDARGNTRALAEAWNGSSWTTQNVASIDAPTTSLSAVSCKGPDFCIAVGSYQGTASGGPFAERWDGSSWTVQFLPNPAGATGFLNSVSCGASDACTAVGFEFDNRTGQQLPLVEIWNASSGWNAQMSPTPAGAIGVQLTGVSCTSPTACTAVGSYFQRTGPPLPMAESRVGSTWRLEAMPVPSGAIASFPSSVSCSGPDACTAVGAFITRTQEVGLAERWNGFAWSQQTVPAPGGAGIVNLAAVSCASASACTAVGGAASQTSAGPVAEVWNGSGWSVQSTPPQPGGFLGAVSCAARTSCTAVGTPGLSGSPAPIRPDSLPRPGLLGDAPRVSSLGALAAARSSTRSGAPALPQGAAVPGAPRQSARREVPASAMYRPPAAARQLGEASSTSTSLTLAEHWNGTSWTIEPTPGFTGAAVSQAIGVSCGSPTTCFATGTYVDNSSGAQLPLLEQWNGARWSIRAIPTPPGVIGGSLFDVSCTAANACTAVGEAFSATSELAFADRWDGTKWTPQRVQEQPGLGSALGSVSCTAATACTAVGALLNDQTGTLSTLAEFWNGSKWVKEQTVNQGGNNSSYLYGVSCSASNACIAVGGYNSNVSPVAGPLSELRSGASWQLKSVPAPPNAMFNLPDPVSCSAADACTAVGVWFSSRSGGAFAVRWNGKTWAQQQVPRSLFVLNGVACVTATACLATSDGTSGVWNGVSWTTQPLAPPPVGSFASLNGVSCSTRSGQCMAVGSAFTGEPVPLAERYS